MRSIARDPAADRDPDDRGFGSSSSTTAAHAGAWRPSSSAVALADRARDGDREAFEALISPRIEPAFPGRFDAWLGRIVVNACRSMGRRRGRAKVREIPIAALSPDDDPPNREATIEDETARLDELERAFDRLSVAQRSLLALHHLDRRSVGELAAILNVPEGTVKWRLHAAREALERSLAEERR